MNNYPEGADLDQDAPWHREDDYIELKCDECNGVGTICFGEDRCFNCDGEGLILIPRDNKFDIEYDED